MARTKTIWVLVTPFLISLAACGESDGAVQEEPDPGNGSGIVAAEAPTEGEGRNLPEWVNHPTTLERSEAEISAIELETVTVEHRSVASRLPVMGRVMAHQHRSAIVSYPFLFAPG